MEQAVKQHRIESKTFEVKMNQVLNENERLLEQVMSKDIVNLLVNPSVENDSVNVHECQKCLKLETELQTDFVKRETYDKLSSKCRVCTDMGYGDYQIGNGTSSRGIMFGKTWADLFSVGQFLTAAMASEHTFSGPTLHEILPATIIQDSAKTLHPSTPFVHLRKLLDSCVQRSVFTFITTLSKMHHLISNSSNNTQTPNPPSIPNEVDEDNQDIEVAQWFYLANRMVHDKDNPNHDFSTVHGSYIASSAET
ncbi:hypothetical protein Tco_0526134 [Tanacetum coccineum]